MITQLRWRENVLQFRMADVSQEGESEWQDVLHVANGWCEHMDTYKEKPVHWEYCPQCGAKHP